MSILGLTFKDKDGSLAIPEIAATGGAILVLCSAVRDFFTLPTFPYVEIGAAISAVVITLATAQRVRDGLWKGDGQ